MNATLRLHEAGKPHRSKSSSDQAVPVSHDDLALMRRIGELHPEHPITGTEC
jgi:hypothetical protein